MKPILPDIQEEEHPMSILYAGLDVSLELTSICVITAEGSLFKEAKVASDPEAISMALLKLDASFERIGLEAGPLSQWLFFGLKDAGLPVCCIETRHSKAAIPNALYRAPVLGGLKEILALPPGGSDIGVGGETGGPANWSSPSSSCRSAACERAAAREAAPLLVCRRHCRNHQLPAAPLPPSLFAAARGRLATCGEVTPSRKGRTPMGAGKRRWKGMTLKS
jgi:hypothetical protein